MHFYFLNTTSVGNNLFVNSCVSIPERLCLFSSIESYFVFREFKDFIDWLFGSNLNYLALSKFKDHFLLFFDSRSLTKQQSLLQN